MLGCRACILRCMQHIVDNAHQPLRTRAATRVSPSTASACHRKLQWSTQRAQYGSEAEAKVKPPRHLGLTPSKIAQPHTGKSARSQEEPGQYKPSALRRELSYLPDPLKLGDRVRTLLQQGLINKANELVRLASKNMLCTVSWNHVVKYYMEQGRPKMAEKTYNEMKKRAQQPDAYTYTILFQGLAKHASRQNNLAQALSIYHSMFADNAPVKPSIIHTNAVLNVCAFGGHMDAIWGIAAKLPTRGPNAPDLLTYTIILHAIRNSIRKAAEENRLGRDHPGRREAVRQGAILSQEIIEKWRRGDLRLDEELVCAMGRILSYGTPDIVKQVFGLLEQTAGLPVPKAITDAISKAAVGSDLEIPSSEHMTPPPAAAAEEFNDGDKLIGNTGGSRPDLMATSDVTEEAPVRPEFEAPSNEHISSPSTVPKQLKDGDELIDDVNDTPSNVTAASVDFVKPGKPASTGYVPPKNNTLSLALEACRVLEVPEAAVEYYELLKGPKYRVLPDRSNYHDYLRCLRISRGSERAMNVVVEMQERSIEHLAGGSGVPRRSDPPFLTAATFRVAMSACRRASYSPDTHKHAYKIIQVMLETAEQASCLALSDYATVLLDSPFIRDDWRAMLEAIELIHEGWLNVRSFQSYTADKPEGRRLTGEMMVLARQMNAIHRLIQDSGKEEAVPADLAKAGRQSRSVRNWVQLQKERPRRTDVVEEREKPTEKELASEPGERITQRFERRDSRSRATADAEDEELLPLDDEMASATSGRNVRKIERREDSKDGGFRNFRWTNSQSRITDDEFSPSSAFRNRDARGNERREGSKDRYPRNFGRPDPDSRVTDDEFSSPSASYRNAGRKERRESLEHRRPRTSIRPNPDSRITDDKFSSPSASYRNAGRTERRESSEYRRPRISVRPDARGSGVQEPQVDGVDNSSAPVQMEKPSWQRRTEKRLRNRELDTPKKERIMNAKRPVRS